jgi:hypothetical protein
LQGVRRSDQAPNKSVKKGGSQTATGRDFAKKSSINKAAITINRFYDAHEVRKVLAASLLLCARGSAGGKIRREPLAVAAGELNRYAN